MIVEAIPNFSEGRDDQVIKAIAAAAAAGSHLLDVHADAIHNRTVVTVAATSLDRLVDSLAESAAVARDRIDLRSHSGVHPRVGAADVMPLVPLAGAGMEECIGAAHRLGARIWGDLQIPVYFYGEAARRPEAQRLSSIRTGSDPPDLGGPPHETAGAVSVGARAPLVAYNLLLPGADLAAAAQLAAAIRESSGGMPGVQALAFDLGAGLRQLSMNLFRLEAATPAGVLERAVALAADLGVTVGGEEIVGLCPAAAADTPAAAGRVLEARLAAAAARAGARRCRSALRHELALLAQRLEERADALAALDVAGDGLLKGAEEAAALPRVLERAGVLDADTAELFAHAARALRSALRPEVSRAYPERLEALDRWLTTPPALA